MATTSNIYDLSDTWDDGATEFTAIKMDVTDTASASASKLIDLQTGSSSKFSVDKDGNADVQGSLTTVTGDHAGGTTSVDVRKANAKYSTASVDAEPGASLINLDGAALTLTLGSDLAIGDIVTVYANPSTTGDVTITSGSGGPNLRINGETSNAAGDVTVADGTLAVITMVSNSIAVISGSDVS